MTGQCASFDQATFALMTRAIRTKAKELLGFGLSKQVAFDTIVLEHPEVKPKKVAEMLRYMPTQWSKERYKTVHAALLGLITLSALLRVAGPILNGELQLDMPTAYLMLVPIASFLLGYSLYRWHGEVFLWVGWGNAVGVFGLLKEIRQFDLEATDIGELFMKLMSVAIGVLSLYLAHRAFAKPKEVKDPQGIAPPRFAFADEMTA